MAHLSKTNFNLKEPDMATKKPMPFTGKESKREEAAEKKFGKAAYMKGERKEMKKMPGTKKKC